MTQKSYDRQEGETSKAYQAFTLYRNMGVSRSLEACASSNDDRTAVEFYPTPETPHKPR